MHFCGYFDVPVWGILLSCCTFLFYLYSTKPYTVWTKLSVPGPKPAPLFGNINEMFSPKMGVRAAVQTWQARYGRVFGIYLFRKPVLVVTDPEVLKQVFSKDFNSFVDRFFVGEGRLQHTIISRTIFFATGPTWRRLRKIMTPTFSSGKLKLVSHHINRTATLLGRNLLQYAQLRQSAEAKVVFGAYALDVIAGTAFGLETDTQCNFQEPFIVHAKSLMTYDKALQLKLAVAGIFPALIPVLKLFNIGFFKHGDIKFFQDNLNQLIVERSVTSDQRLKHHFDFMRLLMDAEFEITDNENEADSKLSNEEVAAQCLFFLIAGYETTSTTLQYLAYELAKNTEVQDKILAEIDKVIGEKNEPTYENCSRLKYTEAALEEALRMYPPVNLLTRQTTKATVLNGIAIPVNTGIMIPTYNIGRDPDFFIDPDTFQPERFLDQAKADMNPITFLPFGYGPRQCIGLRMAMLEMKIAVVHLVRSVAIVGATPEVLEIEDFSGTLAPKVPIEIALESRAQRR